jgi:hypothetical protein
MERRHVWPAITFSWCEVDFRDRNRCATVQAIRFESALCFACVPPGYRTLADLRGLIRNRLALEGVSSLK